MTAGSDLMDQVTVTTVVATDPTTAFQVFTGEVDLWWKRGPRYRFVGDGGGTLRFEGGERGAARALVERDDRGGAFTVGRVLAWEPGERLAFEWRGRSFAGHERTEVHVRFAAEGTRTRVTVEHRGWSTLPADHPTKCGLGSPALDSLIGLRWADLLLCVKERAEAR
jgi:uncharacterized protein YndB with AHSA1/START domain